VPQGVKVQVLSSAPSLKYGTSRDFTLTLRKLQKQLFTTFLLQLLILNVYKFLLLIFFLQTNSLVFKTDNTQ